MCMFNVKFYFMLFGNFKYFSVFLGLFDLCKMFIMKYCKIDNKYSINDFESSF